MPIRTYSECITEIQNHVPVDLEYLTVTASVHDSLKSWANPDSNKYKWPPIELLPFSLDEDHGDVPLKLQDLDTYVDDNFAELFAESIHEKNTLFELGEFYTYLSENGMPSVLLRHILLKMFWIASGRAELTA